MPGYLVEGCANVIAIRQQLVLNLLQHLGDRVMSPPARICQIGHIAECPGETRCDFDGPDKQSLDAPACLLFIAALSEMLQVAVQQIHMEITSLPSCSAASLSSSEIVNNKTWRLADCEGGCEPVAAPRLPVEKGGEHLRIRLWRPGDS